MTKIPRIYDHLDVGIILGNATQNVDRAIRRMVVDDDVLITILRKVRK